MSTTYTPWQKLGHQIASTKVAVWFSRFYLPHMDRLFFRLSGGRTSLTALVSGLPIINLTSIGAKSGLPRTVPLVGLRDLEQPGCYAVIASNWGQAKHPSWYFNLKANPNVTCTIAGKTSSFVAAEATGSEYDRFWGYAVQSYVGFPKYKARAGERQIAIFALTPKA